MTSKNMPEKTAINKTINLTDSLYEYLLDHSVHEHEVLKKIRHENSQDHLTSIMQITPDQGQFMALLIKLLNAKRVLEVGTSTGYSSLVMALALPKDGQLVTCDLNVEATNKAQQYWNEAEVNKKITLHQAAALDSLNFFIKEGLAETFDLAFIDADKINYGNYFEACMKLVRAGGLIIIDNVLWGGAVVDNSDNQAETMAIRELNAKLLDDPRVEISMLPISDGLTLARKI